MTGPVSSSDPRAGRRAALRRATLQLVLGVVALDAVALAIYYLGGVVSASPSTRQTFVVVWTVATAITVAVLLRRVRAARFSTRSH
ncbi:MAG: hypothetical protein ACJ8AD_20520 [Gemmatimonadaceae bacterium]